MRILKQDDFCHWYLIPLEAEDRFIELLDALDLYETEFEEEFEQYRLNKHISCLLIKDYEIR